ncbi:MAG TPA: hypothetical protein VJL32_00415 [Candidatus Paceibacterota bacterium]
MKKFLFFVGALVLIAAIVGVGYWLSQRKSDGGQAGQGDGGGLILPEDIGGTDGLPEGQSSSSSLTETEPIKTIADVFDFYPISENELIYIKTDGKIIRERGGVLDNLSGSEITDLQDSAISPDGSFVFARFGNRNSPQSSVLDTKDKAWRPLAESISAYSWSPTGSSLAYFTLNQNSNDLIIKDFSDPKSKPKKILTLHARDLDLKWVAKDKILVMEKASAYTTGAAWTINPSNATLESVFPDQLGLRLMWGGVPDRGLIWTGNRAQKGGVLLLIGPKQNILQQFEFMTLPEKCAFNTEIIKVTTTTRTTGSKAKTATTTIETTGDTYLFCGVPQDQRSFQINPIPDAYDQRIIYSEDNVYKIDLKNGNIQLLPREDWGPVDVKSIKVFGGKVFILNRLNNNLLELPAI